LWFARWLPARVMSRARNSVREIPSRDIGIDRRGREE